MPNRGRPPKLSAAQVAELRFMLGDPLRAYTNKELQARFNITYLTLRKVKKGLHPYEFVEANQVSDPQ